MVSIDMEAFRTPAGAATLRRLMMVDYKTLIDDDCGDLCYVQLYTVQSCRRR